jgi:hypothetical protein
MPIASRGYVRGVERERVTPFGRCMQPCESPFFGVICIDLVYLLVTFTVFPWVSMDQPRKSTAD